MADESQNNSHETKSIFEKGNQKDVAARNAHNTERAAYDQAVQNLNQQPPAPQPTVNPPDNQE